MANFDSSIDTFKSTLGRRTGFAKANRFAVYMNLPLISVNPGTILTNIISGNTNPLQIFNDPRDISLLCETASLPGRTINTADYQTNMKVRKMPQGYLNDDVSFTFLLTGDMYIKNTFTQWQDSIVNTENKTAKYKDDFTSTVIIQQLNDNNDPAYTCRLLKAYPVSISQIDLGNTNENTISRVTVTFAYDDWDEQNLGGALLGGAQRLLSKFL